MPHNGSHLICEKHLEETDYCFIEKDWVCISCQLEESSTHHSQL